MKLAVYKLQANKGIGKMGSTNRLGLNRGYGLIGMGR